MKKVLAIVWMLSLAMVFVGCGCGGGSGGDSGGSGSKILFYSDRDGTSEIYTMDADGSNQTRITSNNDVEASAKWSPDHSKIVFQIDGYGYNYGDGNDFNYSNFNAEIYVINADGSNQTRLTNNTVYDGEPEWSPDGTRIAFTSNRDDAYEIYVMDVDGGNQTKITNDAMIDKDCDALPPLVVPTIIS